MITRILQRALRIFRRPPDFVIGEPDAPYLLRWWVIPRSRTRPNIYLHRILRDDDDRALHDHPWDNVSIVLRGNLTEVMADGSRRVLRPGHFAFRNAEDAHRLEVPDGPVWTLFLTGVVRRVWGLWCGRGWVHWRDFTAGADMGRIGKGCGE